MTSPLRDGVFELGGVPFGARESVDVQRFDQESASVRAQDSDGSGDWRQFGVDRRSPGLWSWQLTTVCSSEAAASDAVTALTEVWSASPVRETPGAVVPLRYGRAGRTRMVFGRPRRFSEVRTVAALSGVIPITADFARADLLHYADVESSKVLTLAAAPSGGYRAPFRVPLRAVGGVRRVDQVAVGGSTPTWAVVEFTGAATNPWVEVAGWRVQLARTLAYDQTVTVDARPWVQCAFLPDGTPVPGWLTASTRLTAMRLPPGTHTAAFGCDASTGPVAATIRWRDASLSL